MVFVAVVAQAYKVSVEVLSASKGCTAVLRCVVPSFVKEMVKVVSWVQDPSTYIYPKLQGGESFAGLWSLRPTWVANHGSCPGYPNELTWLEGMQFIHCWARKKKKAAQLVGQGEWWMVNVRTFAGRKFLWPFCFTKGCRDFRLGNFCQTRHEIHNMEFRFRLVNLRTSPIVHLPTKLDLLSITYLLFPVKPLFNFGAHWTGLLCF